MQDKLKNLSLNNYQIPGQQNPGSPLNQMSSKDAISALYNIK